MKIVEPTLRPPRSLCCSSSLVISLGFISGLRRMAGVSVGFSDFFGGELSRPAVLDEKPPGWTGLRRAMLFSSAVVNMLS